MDKSITDKRTGDPNTNIGLLRQAIDEIDEKIMELINQRLSLAKQVGDFKKQGGIQITDSNREKKIVSRLLEKNKGPVSDNGLRNIFEAIIAEGRDVQRPDYPGKIERKND
ncbi:MAG: chorismate mutase [Desulfobacterales bacterium]|jgi:chorismate mutase/prephenate dehydratase